MNILIIGATGYIGSHVTKALIRAGHRLAAVQRPGGRPLPSSVRPVPADLAQPETLTAAAADFDKVVHVGVPVDDATDLAGVDALLAAGSPLIYTTGAAVLGGGSGDETSPPNPHPIAAGRPALERRVLDAGGWIVRPGLVYGYDSGLVHGLLTQKAAEYGMGIYIGPPGTRWPVVHVDDLAALYVAVVANAAAGTVWHGISETVRLDAIAKALGGNKAISWPLAEATAELGPLADLFTRDQDLSSQHTRDTLGWTPAHTSIVADLTATPH
jgi:nucleoside-diphosphate-sugar epimerase